MEKLIELFKEYVDNHGTDTKGLEKEYGVIDDGQSFLYGTREYSYLTLISKSFGFIKWLVENDKIDIKKLVVKGEMRSGWDFENKKGDEEEGEEIWNKYYSELCLMLLSISDTPIEDLISYLK